MKRITLVIGIILLLAGLTAVDSSTWPTYSSDELDISLKYPGDWGDFVSDGEAMSITKAAMPIPMSITIFVTELDDDDAEDEVIVDSFGDAHAGAFQL